MTPRSEDVVRPLPDRVRTSVFNMLHGHLEGHAVFDAFAGVGSFGLEAASRGAAPVLMIERDKQIAKLLEENVEHLGAQDRVEVVCGDALGQSALARSPMPVHVAFFDPPYPMMRESAQRRRILDQFTHVVAMLDDTGYALLRSPWPFVDAGDDETEATPIDLHIPGAKGPETHVYGSTAVHWYMQDAGDVSGEGA